MVLDYRTFQIEREECASMIDSPSELHGWYLCVALVCLMSVVMLLSIPATTVVGPMPCRRVSRTPLVEDCIHHFFYVPKGREQWGPQHARNLHTIVFQLVDTMWTSTKAELE